MRLLIHPAYQRTATTWLQTRGLPSAGVWLLGKGSAGDGSTGHWDESVRQLQYGIFRPAYRAEMLWDRVRNSAPEIREYARALALELRTAAAGGRPGSTAHQPIAAGTQLAVLSDEMILGYGGPEVNAPLLSYLITRLRAELGDVELDVDVVLTIREQASLLQSWFAADYVHQREQYRDFDTFVDACLESPTQGLFGTLHYDDVREVMSATLPPSVRLRFVPYELLPQQGAQAFIDAFLDAHSLPPDISILPVDDALGRQVANKGDAAYRVRDFPVRHRVFRGVPWALAGFAPAPLCRFIRTQLNSDFMRRLAPTEATRLRSDLTATLTDDQRQAIRSVYAAGNRALEGRLGLDLGGLGYAV